MRPLVRNGCLALAVVFAASAVATSCSKDSQDGYQVVGASSEPTKEHSAEAIADLPDGDQIGKESASGHAIPDPFYGFRLTDQTGTYVNTKNGERTSWQAPKLAKDAPEVWFFGGSALFGYGTQRDEFTVASDYARAAAEAGAPVRVRNFAVPGYTSYQEVQKLASLLSAGGRPKLVIFLDGYNDSLLTTGNGIVGDPWAGQQSHSQWHSLLKLGESSPRWPGPRTGFVLGPPKEYPKLGTKELAAVVTRLYAQAVDLADHLGKGYGFDVVHAWQPDLYSKALVGDEKQVREANGVDDELAAQWLAIMTKVRAGLPGEVVDMTTVFDEEPEPIMADMMHFNEQGASIIADQFWSQTSEQFQAG